ncbi:hypothetical protein [Poseidonocella sp. HB161398]|uniref:hypothetical protein n=1 Tax=Poseidonocella sp. HB161398 TaxID=2320855 RepID=UPI001109CE12|nr:hypothetical protein [Poseidonocella sp. HB161398]
MTRSVPALAGLALVLGGLAGCSDTPPETGPANIGPAELALFGDGYPEAGDPCLRAGETAYTNQYLSDAADLVACPPGTDAGLFTYDTGGAVLAEHEGWTLFTVPRR